MAALDEMLDAVPERFDRTVAEYVQGVRDFADWLEANADTFEYECVGNDFRFLSYQSTKEGLARAVKAVGRGEKNGDENWFNVTRKFGPVEVHLYTMRQAVCKRVVTGTKEVTKEIVDPDAPMVFVTEIVEEVEWVCDEPILTALEGGA